MFPPKKKPGEVEWPGFELPFVLWKTTHHRDAGCSET